MARPGTAETGSRTKVAFVFSQFPRYDEVFILREMVRLDALLDLTILSLKPARREPVRHDSSTPLLARTLYAGLFHPRVLRSCLGFLVRRPGRFFRALAATVRINRVDGEFLFKSLALFPQAVHFARICRERGIERVHGQWATYPAGTALVISILNGIPFSFTGHAHDIHVKTAGLAEKMRRADFVLTCTAHNQVHLLGLAPDLPPEKIRVVYHGVDLDSYRPKEAVRELAKKAADYADYSGQKHDVCSSPRAREKLNGPAPEERPFRIVSVGSLFECKGFDRLIESCALLKIRSRDFRCRIVGGGPLRSELEGLAAERGVADRIEFTGYQSQEGMPADYAWADLCVLPAVLAIHWGIPNVLIESLAAGTPVACTPLPSLPELIEDPPCGFVIPENDPAALAELIEKIAGDRALLIHYGKEGRKKVEAKWDVGENARVIAEMMVRDSRDPSDQSKTMGTVL
jgi:glycosyltransferase involved in cell wall biosynthesis